MTHLHCQHCGAHFRKRAELDHHNRRSHRELAQSAPGAEGQGGQRGELAADAAGGIQERPAGSESVNAEGADGAPGSARGRKNHEFTRSPKE